MNQCPIQPCNQPVGHYGMHGTAIAPGVVVAPHGGGETEISDWMASIFLCDSCKSAMVERKYNNGGTLKCTKCSQEWNFRDQPRSARGWPYITSLIATRLYPSNMKENSALYREYVEYWKDDNLFKIRAIAHFGLADSNWAAEQEALAIRAHADWMEKHPVKVSLWKRFTDCIRSLTKSPG